jgi:hypothetical protein
LRPRQPHGSWPCAPRTCLQWWVCTYAPLSRAHLIAVLALLSCLPLQTRAPLHHDRPRPWTPLLLCVPLLPCVPHYRSYPTRCSCPSFAPHETFVPSVGAPRGVRAPHSRPTRRTCPPCAPIEAVRVLPHARLFGIISSKLLFILPLRHPGLQLS